jgi:hypothetical protein
VGGREDRDEGLNEIEMVLITRNEAMDATHLAEFFQVEGVVADYDITLGHLIGTFILILPIINVWLTEPSVHAGILCKDWKYKT